MIFRLKKSENARKDETCAILILYLFILTDLKHVLWISLTKFIRRINSLTVD